MKINLTQLLAVTVSLFTSMLPAVADNAGMSHLSGEKWMHVEGSATVESINPETRELTLRDKTGDLATIKAGEDVERFSEIEVGDEIVAGYWVYLRAEFREPTAEEQAAPLKVIAAAGKAIEGMPPTAAIGAVVQAVVTVKVIDGVESDVTVQGPAGRYVTIPVETQEILERLNVGQQVILTFGEAMALELEKAEMSVAE